MFEPNYYVSVLKSSTIIVTRNSSRLMRHMYVRELTVTDSEHARKHAHHIQDVTVTGDLT